jgi:hypothetical protein
LAIPEGASVNSLIRKTKTHEAGDDAEAKVLIDADLAILGSERTGLPRLRRENSTRVRLGAGTRIPTRQAASSGEFRFQAQDFPFPRTVRRTGPAQHGQGDRVVDLTGEIFTHPVPLANIKQRRQELGHDIARSCNLAQDAPVYLRLV